MVLLEPLEHQKKKFSIDFSNARAKFCLKLHYIGDNSYLFVNGEEIYKFTASNGNDSFSTRFCLGSICDGFSATESEKYL